MYAYNFLLSNILLLFHYRHVSTIYQYLYVQFQLSKIVGCEMVRQNDLTFDFELGSCNSFIQPKPRILLCFDYDSWLSVSMVS